MDKRLKKERNKLMTRAYVHLRRREFDEAFASRALADITYPISDHQDERFWNLYNKVVRGDYCDDRR